MGVVFRRLDASIGRLRGGARPRPTGGSVSRAGVRSGLRHRPGHPLPADGAGPRPGAGCFPPAAPHAHHQAVSGAFLIHRRARLQRAVGAADGARRRSWARFSNMENCVVGAIEGRCAWATLRASAMGSKGILHRRAQGRSGCLARLKSLARCGTAAARRALGGGRLRASARRIHRWCRRAHGEPVRLSRAARAGQFLATWCGPCREKYPASRRSMTCRAAGRVRRAGGQFHGGAETWPLTEGLGITPGGADLTARSTATCTCAIPGYPTSLLLDADGSSPPTSLAA